MQRAFKIFFFLSALVMVTPGITPAFSAPPVQKEAQAYWEKRFQELDQNRDGMVSLAEYLAFFREGSPMRRRNIEYEFRKYDRNGDGFITREEHFTPVTLADQFRALDTNRDGRVSRDEFLDADIIFQALDRNHHGFFTLEEYLYRYGNRSARR